MSWTHSMAFICISNRILYLCIHHSDIPKHTWIPSMAFICIPIQKILNIKCFECFYGLLICITIHISRTEFLYCDLFIFHGFSLADSHACLCLGFKPSIYINLFIQTDFKSLYKYCDLTCLNYFSFRIPYWGSNNNIAPHRLSLFSPSSWLQSPW